MQLQVVGFLLLLLFGLDSLIVVCGSVNKGVFP